MEKKWIALGSVALALGAAAPAFSDNSTTRAGGQSNQMGQNQDASQAGNTPGSGTTATSPNPNATSSTGSMGDSVTAVPAPENWTQLSGTAQDVDKQANTIKLQETNGSLTQVSVDKNVKIQKDGKEVRLRDVKVGDSIALTNKKSSSYNKG